MAKKVTQDFIGFTFDGVSSSDLGIVRISNSDRFNEQLQSEIRNITAEVPGVNGEYYFGSTYGNKEITIDIAYDSLTESQFRKLRQLFGGQGIHELIFDERPYKKYLVRLNGPIELNYICFDEYEKKPFSKVNPSASLPDGIRMISDGQGNRIKEKLDPWVLSEDSRRIYKGEGTINLIAYFPFAKSVYKWLPEEAMAPANMDEWKDSINLLSEAERSAHNIDEYYDNKIKIYNAGDVDTGFRLYCPFVKFFTETGTITTTENTYQITHSSYKKLVIGSVEGTFDYTIDEETNIIYFSNLEPNTIEITISYLYYDIENLTYSGVHLDYIYDHENVAQLYFKDKTIEVISDDEGFIIDTNNGLIVGVVDFDIDVSGNAFYTTTGNLYNQYIESGYFFKLKPSAAPYEDYIEVVNGNEEMQIFYDYLYF